MRPALVTAYLLACVSCTEFPQLDIETSQKVKNAPFPTLLPLDQFSKLALDGPETAIDPAAGLELRVARLRARAAQLRALP